MARRPGSFSVIDIKRPIKVAIDLGMTVTGHEISADGGIHVRTEPANSNSADAAPDG